MTSDESPSRPWLSVIIPTHKGERWIRDTLDSLACQREQGFECIFIDSSPDDGTYDVIQSYADRLDMRVHRRPDLGAAHPHSAQDRDGADHAVPHDRCQARLRRRLCQ